MNYLRKTSLLAVSLSVFAFGAQANELTGTLTVTAEIGDGCDIGGVDTSGGSNDFGTIDFGSHSALSSIIDAQGGGASGIGFEMNCTTGLTYNIGLGDGLDAVGGQRRMADPSSTDYIAYQLYQDSARATEWREIGSAGGFSAVGTGATETHLVYGRILPDTTPPAGFYTDTVQVTVTW